MTRVGCGEVVQFARTHGCNAKMVDLSHCQLDDVAATDELSRLVKNSGTWCGAHASPLCNRNAPFNPPASPFAPCPPPSLCRRRHRPRASCPEIAASRYSPTARDRPAGSKDEQAGSKDEPVRSPPRYPQARLFEEPISLHFPLP